MIVEFGTHATVRIEGGRRTVERHSPPRDWHAVLTDFGRIIEARSGGSVLDRPISIGDPTAAKPAPRRPALSAAEAQNVLNNPLLRVPGTSRNRVEGIRLRTGESHSLSEPSLGQYTDFRSQSRKLPQLNCHTIMGILRQDRALDGSMLDEATLTAIARAATKYRCEQGVYGGTAGPESAELYIRIFRAMQLQPAALAVLTAEGLERMYLAYLRVHAS